MASAYHWFMFKGVCLAPGIRAFKTRIIHPKEERESSSNVTFGVFLRLESSEITSKEFKISICAFVISRVNLRICKLDLLEPIRFSLVLFAPTDKMKFMMRLFLQSCNWKSHTHKIYFSTYTLKTKSQNADLIISYYNQSKLYCLEVVTMIPREYRTEQFYRVSTQI